MFTTTRNGEWIMCENVHCPDYGQCENTECPDYMKEYPMSEKEARDRILTCPKAKHALNRGKVK